MCVCLMHIMASTSALTDGVTLWSCEQADTVARELLPLKRALKVKTFWDSATDLQRAELLSLSLSCLRTHAARHSQPPGTLRLSDAYLLFSLPCACNQLDHTNLQHCMLVNSLAHSLTHSLTHSCVFCKGQVHTVLHLFKTSLFGSSACCMHRNACSCR